MSNDGKTLFASSATQVFAWAYDAAAGTISGDRRVVINGMGSSGHTTRTLLMSEKSPGTLIVSYGSNGNIDPAALNAQSGVSQIRAFDVSTLPSQPINYSSGGKRLGWGLRNSVGVAEHPVSGGIYSVENSADELTRDNVDIHQDNPGEELNFHGTANSTTDGGNHGYPTCFALWDTNVPSAGNLTTGNQFVTKTDGSNGATDAQCNSNYIAPRLTFPAHTAPLDVIFKPDGSAAYVSFHGSCKSKSDPFLLFGYRDQQHGTNTPTYTGNRDDPVGYRLSSIAFSNGEPVAASDSKTAAVDVLTNPSLGACPDNCFRPVGLAFDSAGRLFMTSDSTGDIWVLQNTGATVPSSGAGSATKSAPTPAPTNAAAPSRGGYVGTGGNGGGSVAVVGAFVAAACLAFTSFMI